MLDIEKIKELRLLTQAGIQDCKNALYEANGDIQKAVDIIKVKGQNIISSNKSATEGVVAISRVGNSVVMIEVNCVTDFVARMPEFNKFVDICLESLCNSVKLDEMWTLDKVESERKELMAITKENIKISNWWVESIFNSGAGIFSYIHTNEKIGVILTLFTSEELVNHPDIVELGNNITLQIASMKPLAISSDKLSSSILERQQDIFTKQIETLNKPASSHNKILEGKFNKWYTEVCLLNQEFVILNSPGNKISVGQAIKNLESKLGHKIEIVNFIRCEVGENVEKSKDNFALDAEKMVNDSKNI